jgi:pimeloyl-ACP methyl ester carboxylesterase
VSVITVGQENTTPIELYYEDHGDGDPVVLLAGWPLDSRSWEPQVHELLDAGHRVIAYDRRGFGYSSRPTQGYDFGTLASDLDTVLTELDLSDVTLVGFSLGTGEVARYVGTRGTARLKACVLIETLAPSFRDANEQMVAAVQTAIRQDRFAWLDGVFGDLLNLDQNRGQRVSDQTVRALIDTAADASPWATWACPRGWLEDFSHDITHLDVPTLIVHGTADRILPIEAQAGRLRAALPHSHYVEIVDGPHLVGVTHPTEVNRALLSFLRDTADVPTTA